MRAVANFFLRAKHWQIFFLILVVPTIVEICSDGLCADDDSVVATGAAWLNGNRLTERRKRKRALTSTGLLMEGVVHKSLPLGQLRPIPAR